MLLLLAASPALQQLIWEMLAVIESNNSGLEQLTHEVGLHMLEHVPLDRHIVGHTTADHRVKGTVRTTFLWLTISLL